MSEIDSTNPTIAEQEAADQKEQEIARAQGAVDAVFKRLFVYALVGICRNQFYDPAYIPTLLNGSSEFCGQQHQYNGNVPAGTSLKAVQDKWLEIERNAQNNSILRQIGAVTCAVAVSSYVANEILDEERGHTLDVFVNMHLYEDIDGRNKDLPQANVSMKTGLKWLQDQL